MINVNLSETQEFQALMNALSTALISLYHYAEGDENEPATSAIADIKATLTKVGIGFDVKDYDNEVDFNHRSS